MFRVPDSHASLSSVLMVLHPSGRGPPLHVHITDRAKRVKAGTLDSSRKPGAVCRPDRVLPAEFFITVERRGRCAPAYRPAIHLDLGASLDGGFVPARTRSPISERLQFRDSTRPLA